MYSPLHIQHIFVAYVELYIYLFYTYHMYEGTNNKSKTTCCDRVKLKVKINTGTTCAPHCLLNSGDGLNSCYRYLYFFYYFECVCFLLRFFFFIFLEIFLVARAYASIIWLAIRVRAVILSAAAQCAV